MGCIQAAPQVESEMGSNISKNANASTSNAKSDTTSYSSIKNNLSTDSPDSGEDDNGNNAPIAKPNPTAPLAPAPPASPPPASYANNGNGSTAVASASITATVTTSNNAAASNVNSNNNNNNGNNNTNTNDGTNPKDTKWQSRDTNGTMIHCKQETNQMYNGLAFHKQVMCCCICTYVTYCCVFLLCLRNTLLHTTCFCIWSYCGRSACTRVRVYMCDVWSRVVSVL